MSYENINANTSIVFINGMDNTLEDARNSANLIQRDFLNKQVGIVNNATGEGKVLQKYFGSGAITKRLDSAINAVLPKKVVRLTDDVLEWTPNYFTLKDSLNAYMLRQMTKDSVVINHSAGNEDIYKANYLNALMKLKTDYKLISIGSPKSKKDLRESTNAVGAELVRQVNHPYDPVRAIGSKDAALGYINSALIPSMLSRVYFGNVVSFGLVPLTTLGIGLFIYHPFESYYKNDNFKIKETINNIFIENMIREKREQWIRNDKN